MTQDDGNQKVLFIFQVTVPKRPQGNKFGPKRPRFPTPAQHGIYPIRKSRQLRIQIFVIGFEYLDPAVQPGPKPGELWKDVVIIDRMARRSMA